MAEAILFKCPSCGGNLEFDPAGGRFVCGYCGSSFDEEELRAWSERAEKEAEAKERAEKASARGRSGEEAGRSMREYHCANCGAQIVTEETTAATRCYYCHSPVVLTEQISEAFRPDEVIPFRVDREEARASFDRYIRKKLFVDRRFFSDAQLEDFSGVYYPYWLGDVVGRATFSGEGTTVSSVTTRRHVVTTTRYYRLEREGQVSFHNMVRKALNKADRKLSDGIHPYDLQEAEPFASGYLSGFLAERRDVEEEDARKDIVDETRGYVQKLMTEDSGLSGVSGRTEYVPARADMRYALLPAWVLTYSHDITKRVYYYMMNGQNGRVCGKLPVNRGKLLLFSGLLGLGVFGIMCLGGAFLW